MTASAVQLVNVNEVHALDAYSTSRSTLHWILTTFESAPTRGPGRALCALDVWRSEPGLVRVVHGLAAATARPTLYVYAPNMGDWRPQPALLCSHRLKQHCLYIVCSPGVGLPPAQGHARIRCEFRSMAGT
jgi:hypothetical protein